MLYSSLLTFALVIASTVADKPEVDIGTCKHYALKAATRIDFNGGLTTVHTGDVGISPGDGLSGSFKLGTGSISIGTSDDTDCDRDLRIAYNFAMGLPCDAANNFPELGGKSFLPGVYCSSSSMKISASTVTLDGNGDADARWVFQVPSALTTSTNTKFILQNGAQSKNVFWAIGTSATIGYSSSFLGNILAQTQVTFGSNSVINGRALAFTAIVFESGSKFAKPDLSAPVTVTEKKNLRTAVKVVETIDFNIGDCAGFAVNAGTSANFDGDVTKVTGLAGVSPSTAIQGNYEFTDSCNGVETCLQSGTDLAKSCSKTTRDLLAKAQELTCSPDHTIQGGDLAGLLLTPGVYCSSTGNFLFSAATLRLDAGENNPNAANAKWIFRTDTTLSTATATSFELLHGAKASNVFWAIGTSATLGYSSNFVGTVLANNAVTVGTSAEIVGRVLALTAVTFSDKGVIATPNN